MPEVFPQNDEEGSALTPPNPRRKCMPMVNSNPYLHHYIGYDDKNKGKYCIVKVDVATDSIVARGFETITAAKEEAKKLGLRISPNPYLKARKSVRR